jgi:hypothetical protein
MRAFGIFNPPFDGAQAIVFSVSLFDGGRAVDGESESQLHVPLGTPARGTSLDAPHMSAFGGKRTWPFCGANVCYRLFYISGLQWRFY